MQESIELVEMDEETPVVYNFQQEGNPPAEQTETIQESIEVMEVSAEVPVVYDFPKEEDPVTADTNEVQREGEVPVSADTNEVQQEGNPPAEQTETIQESIEVMEVSAEVPVVYDFPEGEDPVTADTNEVQREGEDAVQQEGEPPILEPVEAFVMQDSEIQISCDVQQGGAPNDQVQDGEPPILETVNAVVMQESEHEIKLDVDEDIQVEHKGETPPEINDDWEMVEPPPQKEFDNFSKDFGHFSKQNLADVITAAAKERKRRESSNDSEGEWFLIFLVLEFKNSTYIKDSQ